MARTPGPHGGSRRGGGPVFVIEKHEASNLHYDFRIEVNGVLKSWAVPKGPSLDPHEKRLAVPTEDHPLDQDGPAPPTAPGETAGTVLVWDTGPYENITWREGELCPVPEALADGHVAIRLHGKKLRGGYALKRIGKGRKARWLLVKMSDSEAQPRRAPVPAQPASAPRRRTVRRPARKTASAAKN